VTLARFIALTGHVPEELDKVIYDEAGDPIPIFNTGYSREWREWNGMQSENLDAMADDQEAHVAAIREDMADYMLSGDAKVKVKAMSAQASPTTPTPTRLI
jgi:hypothetical protein